MSRNSLLETGAISEVLVTTTGCVFVYKLSGCGFESCCSHISDDARLDISARGVCTKYQMTFFNVRVFDPNAKRYDAHILQRCYVNNEKEKKRQHNMRVLQVENGSFALLVFSINGGMGRGREASKFYSRLAEMLSEKRNKTYSITMFWFRRKLLFSLVGLIITCIRGTRKFKSDETRFGIQE